jgi:hypothetical protein
VPRYAKTTEVPVERSRAEIEETLRRYGASAFQTGWNEEENSSMVAFRIRSLMVRFVLPLPSVNDNRFQWRTVRGQKRKATDRQAAAAHEQEIRQRWRCLLLNIKGKLEAVECRISTIEEEFLAHVVLPNDLALGKWLVELALPQIRAGVMPQLALPAPPKDADVQDAEFEVRGEDAKP